MTSTLQSDYSSIVDIASGRVSRWILLAVLTMVALSAASIPAAQAQDSCFTYSSGRLSFNFSQGSFKSGSFTGYRNDDCTNPYDYSFETDTGGWVRTSSYSTAKEVCDRNNSYSTNPRRSNNSGNTFFRCGSGVSTGGSNTGAGSSATSQPSSSSGGSRGGRSGGADPSATPEPVFQGPPTGEAIQKFGIMVSAELGLYSGIQFQRRDLSAVGNHSVFDLGVRDVVDIWGNISGEYEVCFPQAGDIVFLDASTSPRTVSSLEHFTRDGYTCASHAAAGMMVLVNPSDVVSSSDADIPAETNEDHGQISPLTNCEVTTWYRLNLRNAPNGAEILLIIWRQVQRAATARTAGWFRVTYKGTEGWLAAMYLGTFGSCRAGNIA